jgi:hypothetical protein
MQSDPRYKFSPGEIYFTTHPGIWGKGTLAFSYKDFPQYVASKVALFLVRHDNDASRCFFMTNEHGIVWLSLQTLTARIIGGVITR